MEVKPYIFSNKSSNNGEYGWIYMFLPKICSETDLTIELIEHTTYERFAYSKSGLRQQREGHRKIDLVPMSLGSFREVKLLMHSENDESEKINSLIEDVISAHKLMEMF